MVYATYMTNYDVSEQKILHGRFGFQILCGDNGGRLFKGRFAPSVNIFSTFKNHLKGLIFIFK